MGRNRRKFVDKNAPNTHTFALIHRSQFDPRIADPDASKYVLHPVGQPNASRRRRDQQDEQHDIPDLGIPIQSDPFFGPGVGFVPSSTSAKEHLEEQLDQEESEEHGYGILVCS